MSTASRERVKKEVSFIKVHYEYEIVSRQCEEVSTRRALVRDLLDNHPEIIIGYDEMMNLELDELHQLMEQKKLDAKMNAAAALLQRSFRVYLFKRFCFR